MPESLLPAPTKTAAQQWHAFQHDTILFDRADLSVIAVTGNDRSKFLHNFCTNDIKKLAAGEICEAFFCNVKGRVLAHAVVVCQTDRLLIVVSQNRAEFLLAHLDKYLITEDVELTDLREDVCLCYLAGPNAEEISEKFLPPERNQSPVRWDCWDQPGFLLLIEKEKLPELLEMLLPTEVTIGSDEVAEVARVAAGFPKYGVDLSDENLAQEANRTQQAISFTKGCYLGQEPIARLDALGHVNRKLVVVTCTANGLIQVGAKLLEPATDKELGTLTSTATIPETSTQLGIAMLRTTHSKQGTEILVRTDTGEKLPANVSCS